MGGVSVARRVRIKSRPRICLEISLDLLHGAAWLGIYLFLKLFLTSGRAATCAAIGVGVLFVIGCLVRNMGQIRSWDYNALWVAVAEGFIFMLYGKLQGYPMLSVYGMFLGGISLLEHFWCLSFQGMQEYLEQSSDLKYVPGEKIFWTNTRMVTGWLLVMAVLFLGIAFVQADMSFAVISNAFRRLILWIAGLARMLAHMLEGNAQTDTMPEMTMPPSPTGLPEAVDDDHAQGLGVIVALMAIGAVIIYVFVRMILTSQGPKDPQRGQRPVFHRRGSKEDVVEKLETEEKRFLFFRNNRERVRYLFRKQVMNHYSGKVPVSHTAGQLCDAMKKDNYDPWFDRLEEAYEVARYSRRPVSRQDVRILKKSKKNLKVINRAGKGIVKVTYF